MPFSPTPVFSSNETGLFHQGATVSQLEVKSYETETDLTNGYIIYRGGVKAKYGVTTLSADVLIVRNGVADDGPVEVPLESREGSPTVSLRPFEAMALGKVEVLDPDGTMQATNLWFTWDAKRRSLPNEVTGKAESVIVRIATSHINADKVSISNAGYDFSKVSFWTGNWRTPLFKFDADSIFIYPGKKGVAKQMKLSLLGVQLPVVPKYTFSLDPRSEGFAVPTIGFRQDAGIGLSWVGNIPINNSSNVNAALTTFPKAQPTYTLSYSKSAVPESESGLGQYVVSGQFGERSPYSFFGNVYMNSLTKAFDRMKIRKNLFSVTSTFNYETLGRVTDRETNYSLPLEFGFENGGPVGDWAYMFQAKGARIVEDGQKSAARLTLTGSAFSPLASVGRLTLGTRFDATARVDASSSGFFGLETGFSYEAYNNLSFSAGAYGYKNFGTPLFQGDTFQTNQGYVIRGDWFGKSTNISLMYKYDPTQGWFDREYRLSQVMGSVEPVLVYRVSPRQYVFGIRFRTQDISKMLQSRKVRRNNEIQGDNNQ